MRSGWNVRSGAVCDFVSILDDCEYYGPGHRSLQRLAAEGRDEELQTRYLCADRLHLFEDLRQWLQRRVGKHHRSVLLSIAGLVETGLGLVSNQCEQQLHCKRDLRPSVWQRKALWKRMEQRYQCAAGKL